VKEIEVDANRMLSSSTVNTVRQFSNPWLLRNWRHAVLSIGIGCAFFLISLRYSGPAYLEDEIGYLANAAFFAGHKIDAASSFHAGYSLFIAPLFLLSDPHVVWKGVLAINAILWAVNFLLLHSILRRLFPTANDSRLLTATIVSALYPTWVISAGYAFATSAFVAVFLASVFAFFFWTKNNPFSLAPHSGLVGYLYWVHPTGAAVAFASLLAVLLNTYRERDAKSLCLHVGVIAVFIIGYRYGVHGWLTESMTPGGYEPHFHYPSLTSALQTVFTWRSAALAATFLVGQFAYFIVASFGIAFTGMLFCAHRLINGRQHDACRADGKTTYHIYFFICAAPLCIMGLAAVSLLQWDHFEGDFWIYGRYLDGAILPVLATGLVVFQANMRIALVSIFLLAAGFLFSATVPDIQHNIVNSISFWPQYLTHRSSFFVWMLFGAIALAATAWSGKKRLAIGLMLSAFPISVGRQIIWHDEILATFSAPSSLIEIVQGNFASGTCVGFNPALPADATLFQAERYHLNSFYLFNYGYRRMSPAEWVAQCNGPYLTYDISDLIKSGHARLVAREIKSNLFLLQRSDRPNLEIPKGTVADIEVGTQLLSVYPR